MKKIYTILFSMLMMTAGGQGIDLQLSPVKNCTDRTYCLDLRIKKADTAPAGVSIGTSSLLLTYDPAALTFRSYEPFSFTEAGTCPGWLPQRYDAISRQGVIDITLVLGQNGNACPVIGDIAENIGQLCFDIRQQGASPNIRFDLNHSQFNTNDANNGSASVPIVAAAVLDEKNLLVCDCPGASEPCDDGNIYTVNDRYDSFCHCRGEYADTDQDGIPDGVDPCLDQVFEAENASLYEVSVRNNFPQYCGLGFVDYLHNYDDYVEFSVQVAQDGQHQMTFRYALLSGNRPLRLTVDGAVVVPSLDFPETGAWSNWGTVAIDHFLTAGPHAVRLTAIGQSGPNFDQFILSFCAGCAETGQSCDDGDPCTSDDVFGLDCQCGGRYEDSDFDGVCDLMDACAGHDDHVDSDGDGLADGCDPCDNALIGTACDDGDPCTENDRYVADCQCVGIFVGADSDGDGVCDDYDICPNGNDAFDADGDGIPDDCDTCDDRMVGRPCDDGDPCTLLDVMRPNCLCLGIFFDSDEDGVCTVLDLCEGFDDTIDNDGDGLPDACDHSVAVSPKMEIGKAVGVGEEWQTIVLENTYQSMVVVATPILPGRDAQPVVTRIRSAAGNKFELRMQNPGGKVEEFYNVNFVVAEEGVYTPAADGFKMEARKELSVETASKSNYVREQRTYFQPYSSPVVLGQVMTFNDDRWSVFWSSRANSMGIPADSLSFAAGKLVAEDTITDRASETIGFLVFESGKYGRDGVRLEARLGENTIEGTQNSEAGFTYKLDLDKPNHAILSTSGLNGGDGGWPVLIGNQFFRDNTMFLAFDEDQISDNERFHTSEEVSYLAFEFIPALAFADIEKSNVTCHGAANGTAAVSATGGEAPYDYNWSTGDTSATVVDLAAGTYGVTITDANNTKITTTVTVNQPPALDVFLQGSPISCFGENDGFVQAVPVGGTGQHTAVWSNGATGFTQSNLSAGNYTVTISDQNGCTKTAAYEIEAPAALVVNGVAGDATCFGENNGTANITFSGGSGTPAFLWSNGAATPNLTGLPAGVYTVTATDGNGCTATTTVEVEQPPMLEASVFTTFTSCNGGEDGSATVSFSGGTGEVVYQWNTGAATATITNLPTGQYTVTLTDAHGCTTTAAANITDPAMLAVAVTSENASCFGVSDGRAEANYTGGTGGVSYIWSTGATTSAIENLPAGQYAVTVTDENGCVDEAVFMVENADTLTVQAVVAPVNCFGLEDGMIELTAAGASAPYAFSWSNGANEATLTAVAAGDYSVTVNSSEGCEIVESFSVVEPPEMVLETDHTPVACFGGDDATAIVTGTGGTGDYIFQWSTGETTPGITGLSAGTETVTVTDANGCTQTAAVNIDQPDELQIVIDQVTDAIGSDADGAIQISPFGGTPVYEFQWLLNGTFVSGEEDPTGLVAGEYTLLLTDENGCSTSLNVTVGSLTSAAERNLLQRIQLTPNPTSGLFSLLLDLPDNQRVSASLFDVSGKMIVGTTPVSDRHDFDLTNEAPGVYLLRIQVGKLEVAKRVVLVE